MRPLPVYVPTQCSSVEMNRGTPNLGHECQYNQLPRDNTTIGHIITPLNKSILFTQNTIDYFNHRFRELRPSHMAARSAHDADVRC